jgi:hypothetical protein
MKTLMIGVCVLAFVTIVVGMAIGLLLCPISVTIKRGRSDHQSLLPDSDGSEHPRAPSAGFNGKGILGPGEGLNTYGVPLVTSGHRLSFMYF